MCIRLRVRKFGFLVSIKGRARNGPAQEVPHGETSQNVPIQLLTGLLSCQEFPIRTVENRRKYTNSVKPHTKGGLS